MDCEPQSWWEAYQLREEKKRRLESQRAYFYQCRRERQAARKKRLAEKITDGPMLVAALRFYVHCLEPCALTVAEPIHERCKELSRQWKVHLKAARRVLGIEYWENRTVIQLPRHYEKRLRRIGLCQNPAATAQFLRLDPHLEIDASVLVFAEARPYLVTNIQRLLRGELPPLDQVTYLAAEAKTVPPGWCGLMHSSDPDPVRVKNAKSPFKIAQGNPKTERPPRCEPPEDDADGER